MASPTRERIVDKTDKYCVACDVERIGDQVIASNFEVDLSYQKHGVDDKQYMIDFSDRYYTIKMSAMAAHRVSATCIIFQNIEYKYDRSSQTVTVTGNTGCKSARCDFFRALCIGSEEERERFANQQASIPDTRYYLARERLAKAHRQGRISDSKFQEEMEELEASEDAAVAKTKQSLIPDLEARPCTKVVFRGPITYISQDFCDRQMDDIVEVDLSDSTITAINGDCFHLCQNLKIVRIPPTLRRITERTLGIDDSTCQGTKNKMDNDTIRMLRALSKPRRDGDDPDFSLDTSTILLGDLNLQNCKCSLQ